MRLRIAFAGVAIAATLPFFAFAQTDDYGTGPQAYDNIPSYCPRLISTIQLGSRDGEAELVSELQKFLAGYFDVGEIVTGYFGRVTQNYVIQFQKEKGLPALGIVGSLTRAAIAAECPGGPSSQVERQDLVIGSGKVAEVGSKVSVLYTGKLQNGTVFDSSAMHDNQPLQFTLGEQGIISGFHIGVNGMRAGGKRVVTIPSSYGYGGEHVADGSGNIIIPANSTLVFEIELLSVGGETGPSQTASFSASPTSGPAPLTVSFQGSGSVLTQGAYISFGDGTPNVGTINSEGIVINASHIYYNPGTYTATLHKDGAKGEVVGTATITVGSPVLATPKITFNSNLTTVKYGQSATLSWNVIDAQRCYLQYDNNEFTTIPLKGTKVVNPKSTTSYKLLCANDNGQGKDGPSAEKSVTISVLGGIVPTPNVPSCTIKASKTQVTVGETYTISWTTKNISDPVRYEQIKAGGTVAVAPTGSMQWTAEYEGTDTFQIGAGGIEGPYKPLCSVSITAKKPAATPKPTIKVLSPNGGQKFSVADKIAITWSATNVPSFACFHIQMENEGRQITFTNENPLPPTARSFSYDLKTQNQVEVVPGSYKINVSVSCVKDGEGATDSSDGFISVAALTANFTATPVSGVAPLAVSFAGGGPALTSSAFISFGDGVMSKEGEVKVKHTYTEPGTYTATLHKDGAKGDVVATKTINVSAAPAFTIKLTASPAFAYTGESVKVGWTYAGAQAPTATDWIVVVPRGTKLAPENYEKHKWFYTEGALSGSKSITLPSVGTYDIVYLQKDGYTELTRKSAAIEVQEYYDYGPVGQAPNSQINLTAMVISGFEAVKDMLGILD